MLYVKGNNEIYVGCGAGNGYTNEFWVYDPDVPSTPINLTATPVTKKKVNLNWMDNSNREQKLFIERDDYPYGNYEVVDSVEANISVYSDTTVAEENSYYYRVRARGEAGYSGYSNEAFAMTKVPDKPKINYIDTRMDSSSISLYLDYYTINGIS